MRRAVIQSHHSHCYSSNISNRNILLLKKHLSKATFETENTLWFRKAIFDFFSSSHKHIEDFHLHFPKKYPDPVFRHIWIPIQSMPNIPKRLLQMWIYHLQKSNDMTRIKYKIIKFFQVYYFFFFGLLWSPLVVKPVQHPIFPDNPTDLFSFSHIVFYISNIYIPEGFPGDYNNGYIPLQDGIVFYTSLSLNYSVQCSSEYDYHLLLPSQRKNIFPFFPLSL